MIPFDITGPLPDGPMLLEASAGTGKTWTIAGLAVRHIAEAGVPIGQLLLITFSKCRRPRSCGDASTPGSSRSPPTYRRCWRGKPPRRTRSRNSWAQTATPGATCSGYTQPWMIRHRSHHHHPLVCQGQLDEPGHAG